MLLPAANFGWRNVRGVILSGVAAAFGSARLRVGGHRWNEKRAELGAPGEAKNAPASR